MRPSHSDEAAPKSRHRPPFGEKRVVESLQGSIRSLEDLGGADIHVRLRLRLRAILRLAPRAGQKRKKQRETDDF